MTGIEPRGFLREEDGMGNVGQGEKIEIVFLRKGAAVYLPLPGDGKQPRKTAHLFRIAN